MVVRLLSDGVEMPTGVGIAEQVESHVVSSESTNGSRKRYALALSFVDADLQPLPPIHSLVLSIR